MWNEREIKAEGGKERKNTMKETYMTKKDRKMVKKGERENEKYRKKEYK